MSRKEIEKLNMRERIIVAIVVILIVAGALICARARNAHLEIHSPDNTRATASSCGPLKAAHPNPPNLSKSGSEIGSC